MSPANVMAESTENYSLYAVYVSIQVCVWLVKANILTRSIVNFNNIHLNACQADMTHTSTLSCRFH